MISREPTESQTYLNRTSSTHKSHASHSPQGNYITFAPEQRSVAHIVDRRIVQLIEGQEAIIDFQTQGAEGRRIEASAV